MLPSKNKILLKKFAKVFRKRRLKMGVSQEKFAEIAGKHRTYISKIERGEMDIGVSMLFDLAKAYKIRTSTLILDVEKL